MHVLAGGNTPVYRVIDTHTNTGAVYFNGAAGGVAPDNGAVSGGIKVVIETMANEEREVVVLAPAVAGLTRRMIRSAQAYAFISSVIVTSFGGPLG